MSQAAKFAEESGSQVVVMACGPVVPGNSAKVYEKAPEGVEQTSFMLHASDPKWPDSSVKLGCLRAGFGEAAAEAACNPRVTTFLVAKTQQAAVAQWSRELQAQQQAQQQAHQAHLEQQRPQQQPQPQQSQHQRQEGGLEQPPVTSMEVC